MSGHAYFITGTDTEVGKTFVSCALLHAARRAGWSAVGMKPVAAGTQRTPAGEDINEDVAALRAASNVAVAPEHLNPYCFAEPIAPHIAAAKAGVTIDVEHIAATARMLRQQAQVLMVEGVGGFRVPLGENHDTADMACALGLPVILVVGMRLGCLSHALLTVEAIERRGLHLAGWVANRIDPRMARFDENLSALEERIAAPLLGTAPHGTPEAAALALRLPF